MVDLRNGLLVGNGKWSGPSVLHNRTSNRIHFVVAVYTHTCLVAFLSDSPIATLAAALQERASIASSEYPHRPLVRHVDASGRASDLHFFRAGSLCHPIASNNLPCPHIQPMSGTGLFPRRI